MKLILALNMVFKDDMKPQRLYRFSFYINIYENSTKKYFIIVVNNFLTLKLTKCKLKLPQEMSQKELRKEKWFIQSISTFLCYCQIDNDLAYFILLIYV